MKFRFSVEPDGSNHIKKHGVSVDEINEFFNENAYFEQRRKDGSYIAYSKLENGRHLKVIYRKLSNELYFIITAYDLEDQNIIDFINREIE